MDNVVSKITKAMQSAFSAMKAVLTKPEVRKANTQQIKEKARTSIYEMLNRYKAIVAAEDAAIGDAELDHQFLFVVVCHESDIHITAPLSIVNL